MRRALWRPAAPPRPCRLTARRCHAAVHSFDLGWQSVMPHWAYRMGFSIAHDLHMLALLEVSKQLRRTIEQIRKFRSQEEDEELSVSNVCRRVKSHAHYLVDLSCILIIALDIVVAILDAQYTLVIPLELVRADERRCECRLPRARSHA